MNYIVAVLYSYLKDEELTFNTFLSLIVQKGIKPLFVIGVPEYHIRQYMLEQLIKEHLPDLFYHLKKLSLNLDLISGNWLMTLFCGYFPFDQIMPLMDNFFLVSFFLKGGKANVLSVCRTAGKLY